MNAFIEESKEVRAEINARMPNRTAQREKERDKRELAWRTDLIER